MRAWFKGALVLPWILGGRPNRRSADSATDSNPATLTRCRQLGEALRRDYSRIAGSSETDALPSHSGIPPDVSGYRKLAWTRVGVGGVHKRPVSQQADRS